MTNKFMFFENFKETADKLPDELRLKFYDAMTDYVFKGVEPDDVVISALITAIKPSLDKEEKRGGNHNPNGNNQHKVGQSEVKNVVKEVKVGQSGQSFLETETETGNITPLSVSPQRVDDTQLDLEEAIAKTKRFVKPTVEEITSFCREKNKSIDAERFWNFYESKGWKVGKNPMKDWRAAVCNWAKDAAPVVQESYRPAVDTEKLNQTARMAELAKQRMMEQAKLKYGA